MSATLAEIRTVPTVQQAVHCPDCGRFLTAVVMPPALPPATLLARLNCRTCGRWRWFDLATGARYGRDGLTESETP